ncbi:hypothetical protein ZIOFF_068689 [Zingiber officinale]|uniref:GBF-interacting protein 1 N-terminal domain-containing protein n=1 Tax=Zingiber officinale TaxID=94328 RepID=A0A8J5CEX9_ZINOF|nr:hypothetical protein ZIOFF_068689 [Zingiber officinale]
MSGGGARVSIPSGVRRTIQNIKEIAGNHTDEEIYAMLKECSMDPNETAQKLLLQGRLLPLSSSPAPLTPIPGFSFSCWMLSCESSISIRKIDLLHPSGAFGAADRFYWWEIWGPAIDPYGYFILDSIANTFHEVKRKHDKRKENVRESAEPRWRPGVQGRGGRGGRGNYSSRSLPNDAAAGRNATAAKESGLNQGIDKANTSSSTSPDAENKPAIPLSRSESLSWQTVLKIIMAGWFSSTVGHPEHLNWDSSKLRYQFYILTRNCEEYWIPLLLYEISIQLDPVWHLDFVCPFSFSKFQITFSFLSSVSGLVNGPSNIEHLVSSQGSHISGVNGTPSEEISDAVTTKTANSRIPIKDSKGGSASGPYLQNIDQLSSNKPVPVPSIDPCTPAELGTMKQIKPHGSGTCEVTEKSQAASSSFSSAMGIRPSSTYSNRFQHPSGLQKAPLPNKEWKPKSVLANPAQASETNGTSEAPVVIEAVSDSLPSSLSATSEGASVKLGKKVEDLKVSDRQHVIIPNHLQVTESERHGLSFGSFDANFMFKLVIAKDLTGQNIETPHYEPSKVIDETIEKHSLSNSTSSTAEEDDFSEQTQSPEQVTDNYSKKEIVISNSASPETEYNQTNQEDSLSPEGSQNLIVQSTPSYPPVGLVPQLSSQITSFESSESQARESRLPSFLVQQHYDPSTSYFNPFYRPSPDADGRISPFFASSASTRYNGNIALLPAQSGQASQENTNNIVLSTVGSTPLGTQAAGTMQGSLAIPQQPIPVFRQPAGLHISHFSPNYVPYSQYFSPFYAPPPAVHHFLSGAAFPQQPPTGGMYPTPGAATPAAASVKYSLPQYKPGSNTGNSTIVGLPTVYGTYNSTQAGYTSVPAVSTGNSTANEELVSSQFKENNAYISGQQCLHSSSIRQLTLALSLLLFEQSEGPPVWIPAPGRDISSLQASSFYNIPQGQHMTFTPAQAGHGTFSGMYPPTPAVAGSVHPLLQPSQSVPGGVEMLAPPAGVYQPTQHAQINWTNNY